MTIIAQAGNKNKNFEDNSSIWVPTTSTEDMSTSTDEMKRTRIDGDVMADDPTMMKMSTSDEKKEPTNTDESTATRMKREMTAVQEESTTSTMKNEETARVEEESTTKSTTTDETTEDEDLGYRMPVVLMKSKKTSEILAGIQLMVGAIKARGGSISVLRRRGHLRHVGQGLASIRGD